MPQTKVKSSAWRSATTTPSRVMVSPAPKSMVVSVPSSLEALVTWVKVVTPVTDNWMTSSVAEPAVKSLMMSASSASEEGAPWI